MAIIPILVGFEAGEKVQASKLTNHTKTAIEAAVYHKPFCHLQSAVDQSAPSGTGAVLVKLQTVVEDTDNMADPVNGQIIIQTNGLYRITGQAFWITNATGFRAAFLFVDGIPYAGDIRGSTNVGGVIQNLSTTRRLTAGSVLTLRGWQNSGTAINLTQGNGNNFLMAEWISA